jgi:hypothetical protein
MVAVSLNKTVTQTVDPIIELPVGPDTDEIESAIEMQNKSSKEVGKFSLTERKYFPLTRKCMTGSWNGDLGQLSAVKKVISVFVGFVLTILTSVLCAPLIALKNRSIQAFNSLTTEEQSKKILNTHIKKVVAAAKAYQRSPDSHEAKQALEKVNRELAAAIDKIQLEFPGQAAEMEQLIRGQVEKELTGLVLSLRPKSAQDQHRFTIPLAKLVLDGFYPIVNGKANPFMKGVKPQSVTYQFEDGVFSLSPERVIDTFLKETSTNPMRALRHLETNLQAIKRPTEQEAEEVRSAIKDSIAEKLNNPASPEFQSLVAGTLQQCEEINGETMQVMTQDQLNELSDSLVTSGMLTEGQAGVFAAQILGADSPASIKLEEETKKHEKKAKRALGILAPIGIVSALERLGVGPLSRGAAMLAKHLPPKLVEALVKCADVIGKEKLAEIAPKAVALGSAALGLYGLFHGFKAFSGPRLTRGQQAAESFANAVTLRKASFEKLKNIEFQTFDTDATATPVNSWQVEALQKALAEGETLIAQAGDALESAGKNPTPQNVEKAAQLSEKANQRYTEVVKQAESVEEEVQKVTGVSGKPSYVDLSRYFKEAKKAFGKIDKELQGADGKSLRGGKKIDELQRELPQKLDALRAFESVDLQEAIVNIHKVEELEGAIQAVLAGKQAHPSKAEKWEASHQELKRQLQYRQGRIQETLARYAFLKNEIEQMRELINLLTPKG